MNALYFLLIPLVLFLPYPFLDYVYFWSNPDSIFYITLYTSFRDTLWNGEFFPHWIATTNTGLGSLVFYNFSPIPYYITAILTAPFMLNDEQQYLLGIYLAQVFSMFAMHRFLRTHYDNRTALAGAALYTLVPYKFIDIYQHFGLAQSWCLAFIPLWLHTAEGFPARSGIIGYALFAALCFHCHPLTAIAVGPLVVAYILHLHNWQWRPLVKPILYANFLAFALIASYVVSMFTATGWGKLDEWAADKFNPLLNLYHLDDFLGAYSLLILWLVYRVRKQLLMNSMYFWGVALISYTVIATPLSYPLWRYVSVMSVFQFPYSRFQPAMAVATAMLATRLIGANKKDFTTAVAAVYVMFTILCLTHIVMVYKRPKDVSQLVHEIAIEHRIIPNPIHMPHWTNITPNELLLGRERYSKLPLAEVKSGAADVSKTTKADGAASFTAHVLSDETTIAVAQFYTPAWKAQSEHHELDITPTNDGMISLILPKGDHEVTLAVTKTLIECFGDAMSVTAFAILCLHYTRRRESLAIPK